MTPDFFTIDEFCQMLSDGYITYYDGIGFYVSADGTESNDSVSFVCSVVRGFSKARNYVGVNWYNK